MDVAAARCFIRCSLHLLYNGLYEDPRHDEGASKKLLRTTLRHKRGRSKEIFAKVCRE